MHSQIGFSRACRTDKGVHAAANLVALKLQVPAEEMTEQNFAPSIQRINAELPNDIRVHGMVKVTAAFSAFGLCQGRIYEYCCPSYLFQEAGEFSNDLRKYYGTIPREQWPLAVAVTLDPRLDPDRLITGSAAKAGVDKVASDNVPITSSSVASSSSSSSSSTSAADSFMDTQPLSAAPPVIGFRSQYRMSEPRIQELNQLLAHYAGTHSYHNFTIRASPKDRSMDRFIHWFRVVGTFIHPETGIEFVRLQVYGLFVCSAACLQNSGCLVHCFSFDQN